VLVTRRLSTDVIGRFTRLDAARAAFNPPPFLGAVFHPVVDPQNDADDEFAGDTCEEDVWSAS